MSSASTKVAVFASGHGSNFRALCEAVRAKKLSVKIEVLFTNVIGAGAVAVAKEFGIPVVEISHVSKKRSEHESQLLAALKSFEVDWVVLAGYMRLLSPEFMANFKDQERDIFRVVNIHPSLLPAFPGADGYGQAFRYGVKVTGATVHLVSTGLDDGPIVAQRTLEVRSGDTEQSLSERGLKLEHALYVTALQKMFSEPWQVTKRRVVFEMGELT